MTSSLRQPDGQFDLTEIARLLGAAPPAFSAHERLTLKADLALLENPLAAMAYVSRRLGQPHLFVKEDQAKACLKDVLHMQLGIRHAIIDMDDIPSQECLEISWLDGPSAARAQATLTDHLGGAFVPETSFQPCRVILKSDNCLDAVRHPIVREEGDFTIAFAEGMDRFRLVRRLSTTRQEIARRTLSSAQARGEISADIDIEVTAMGARFTWKREAEVRAQIAATLSAAKIDALAD